MNGEAQDAAPESLRKEVEEFLDQWAASIVSNDVDRIAEFTTDDWVVVDAPGTTTREAFHGVVRDGSLQHHSMSFEVLDVRTYGPVAVVRSRGRNTATFQGQPVEADEWTTDVLTRVDGRWRCVLTHLTSVG